MENVCTSCSMKMSNSDSNDHVADDHDGDHHHHGSEAAVCQMCGHEHGSDGKCTCGCGS